VQTTAVNVKTKWVIDPAHSQIAFRVKHLGFSNVRGTFREFDANIYTTGDDFIDAEINFWLNPASISTGVEKRDEHLRSADFFDVEKFKVINFTATTLVGGRKDGIYDLHGELTMKEIKHKALLEVEFGGIVKDPFGNDKALLNLNGQINRKDWDLHWNTLLETGGVLVSEVVWINCEVQLIKQL
jgi:polyisoprenoid-binding protein YceI